MFLTIVNKTNKTLKFNVIGVKTVQLAHKISIKVNPFFIYI